MFSNDITDWLNANATAASKLLLVLRRAENRRRLDRLGIAPDGELAYFYTHYPAHAVRGWYELSELDQIEDATEYAREELGVPAHYLALTGVEGQGVLLYHRDTHAIHDVEFGQFEQLQDGALAPIADSFEGFLRWCMARAEGR